MAAILLGAANPGLASARPPATPRPVCSMRRRASMAAACLLDWFISLRPPCERRPCPACVGHVFRRWPRISGAMPPCATAKRHAHAANAKSASHVCPAPVAASGLSETAIPACTSALQRCNCSLMQWPAAEKAVAFCHWSYNGDRRRSLELGGPEMTRITSAVAASRRRLLQTGAGLLGAGLLLAGCRAPRCAANEPPVGNWPAGVSGSTSIVGICLPRTGTYAVPGEDELKGFELAIEHLNTGDPLIRKISTAHHQGRAGQAGRASASPIPGQAEHRGAGAVPLHQREQGDDDRAARCRRRWRWR